MNQNEGKDARGASRLHAELGQQAFDMAITALSREFEKNLRTSEYVIFLRAWNSAIETAAAVCDTRATMCGERADQCDDHEDAIELKARAWQMKVIAAEINGLKV